jgi:hypothetical protein
MFSWPRIKGILSKAMTANLQPTEESFPEFRKVLIWMRFFLAVAYGTFLGVYDIHSPVMLLHSLNLISFIPVMYAKMYMGVHGDSFGTDIIFAGTLNAVALALLIWIAIFTYNHEKDLAQFTSLLSSNLPSSDYAGGNASSTDASTASSHAMKQPESEF